MKIKLVFILIISNFTTFGQVTETLVDTNKLWSNLMHSDWGDPPPMQYETNFIKFSNDTLIGLNSYKKVFASTDSIQSLWTVIGFIREDSAQKVYYYKKQDTIERILYDFGAVVGDSIHIGGLYGTYVVVDSIDSVFIYDKYVKRFILSGGWEQWYEGIGSSCGVLMSGYAQICGAVYELLCYYENDTLKYHDPDYNVCYLSTVNLNEFSPDNIHVSVFPNPLSSSSVFKIDNLNCTDNTLEIYSALGQKFKTILLDKQATINKFDFPSGLYIYRLILKSGIITGKFEVE